MVQYTDEQYNIEDDIVCADKRIVKLYHKLGSRVYSPAVRQYEDMIKLGKLAKVQIENFKALEKAGGHTK